MDADTFRYQMAQLPEPKTELKPPYWQYWRLDLWQRAQTQDPARFWEWPCIFHTMMVNHWPNTIGFEFGQLGKEYWDACYVPHFGPDDRNANISYSMDAGNYSMNLIHQAYHIHQWETTTGRKLNSGRS